MEAITSFLMEKGLEASIGRVRRLLLGPEAEREVEGCIARSVAWTLVPYIDDRDLHQHLETVLTNFLRRGGLDLFFLPDFPEDPDEGLLRERFIELGYDPDTLPEGFAGIVRRAAAAFTEEIAASAQHDGSPLFNVVSVRRIEAIQDKLGFLQGKVEALGTSSIEVAVSVEEYFKPFQNPSSIFNHTYSLVNRTAEMGLLRDFISSANSIAIINGRGGIGKSKLLLEGLKEIAASVGAPTVLVVEHASPLRASQLPSGRVLLAVDDIHKIAADDRRSLLALVRQNSDRVQLIVTIHPSRLGEFRRSLYDSRFTPEEVLILPELGPLRFTDITQLAREALGSEHADLAERLVTRTGDSPLVTTVAARLLTDREVDPTDLLDVDEAKVYIFDRFADVVTGRVSEEVDPAVARAILSLVSVLGSFNTRNHALLELASEFLGVEAEQLHSALAALTNAGALVLVHGSYRLTPDLLARFVLQRATVAADRRSNGYAERVFRLFAPVAASTILTNLVELLPDVVIQLVRAELKQGHVQIRDLSLGEILGGEVANPYRELAPLLGQLCSDRRLCPLALELLWDLRQFDTRTTKNHPDHAVRVLLDLAELNSWKEPWFYDAILDAAGRWSAQPDAYPGSFSPLDLIDEILQHRFTDGHMVGDRYVWSEEPVSSQRFGDIRRKAIRLVAEQSQSEDPAIQRRALSSLLSCIWAPADLDPSAVGDAEASERSRENVLALPAVRALVERTGSAVLSLEVERTIRRMVRKASPGWPRDALNELLDTLPSATTLRRTRYMTLGWGQYEFFVNIQDHSARKAAMDREVEDIARELIQTAPEARAVKSTLESDFREIADFGVEPIPGYLLLTLASNHPGITKEMAELIIADPESPLSPHLHALLWPLAESGSHSDRDFYVSIVERALEASEAGLLKSVIRPLPYLRFDRSEERAIVQRLVTREEPEVIQAVLKSLHRFPPDATAEVDAIVSAIDIGANPDNADALCEHFLARGIAELPDDAVVAVLDKLVPLPEIPSNGTPTHEFVESLIQHKPVLAVDLFEKRIHYCCEGLNRRAGEYTPVLDPKTAGVSINPGRRLEALTRLTNSMLVAHGQAAYSWLRRTFAIFAGNFDADVIAVLDRLVVDEGRYGVQIVADLVRYAPREFVFQESDFVARMLQAAQHIGTDEFERMEGHLIGSASSDMGMPPPGEPPQPLNTLQKGAETAANLTDPDSVLYGFYKELEKAGEAIVEWHRREDEARG